MSPLISQPIPSIAYPTRGHSPQDVHFDDQFQGHHRSTSVAHLRHLILKRFLLAPIEAPLELEHKGIISNEAVAMEVTDSMVMGILITHPHRVVKGTLTAFHEGMVMVVNIVPQEAMDPIITLLGDGGGDGPQVTHMEQVLNAHHSLNQDEDVNKIDQLPSVTLNKA